MIGVFVIKELKKNAITGIFFLTLPCKNFKISKIPYYGQLEIVTLPSRYRHWRWHQDEHSKTNIVYYAIKIAFRVKVNSLKNAEY